MNCGHKNEMKVWSSQLSLRFKQSQLSPKNVFGASTGFGPMASALVLQCSTNWATKTHTLGAGQFVEFIAPVKGMKHEHYVNCGHTNEMKVWSLQFCLRFKQSQLRWSHLHFIYYTIIVFFLASFIVDRARCKWTGRSAVEVKIYCCVHVKFWILFCYLAD